MRSEKSVKRLIGDLHDTTSPEMDKQVLGDVLRALEKSRKKSAWAGTNIRRTIMKSPMTKLAVAAVIIIAVMLSIQLWDRSTPSAYAFEQTVEAMQGKRSFHIQTYFQRRRKDEFWAQFDEEGRLIRYRQREGPGPDGSLLTLWEAGVQSQYFTPPWGVRLIKRVDNADGGLEGLEEFDPETIVQEIHALVADGRAIMEVEKPAPYARLKTLRVTRTDGEPLRQVVVVDPTTKLVVRVDNYWDWGSEGKQVFHKGTEVLEYNESMDPGLFEPNFPEDTIVIDQVSQEVGMAQGKMTDEEAVVETLRQTLDALAREDYAKASKLCGGAPRRLIDKFFRQWRPVSTISIGSPEYVQNVLPVYRVKCTYDIERDGRVETVSPTFTVRAVRGQPGRWYVTWWIMHTDAEVDAQASIVKGSIIPGVRVGDYTLDMSKDDVLTSLGEPKMIFYRGEKYTLNNLPRRYYMSFGDLSFGIVDGSVTGITVLRPSYKFTNGLGVGDSEQDIIQAFGDNFHLKETERKDYLAYEDKGLMFEIRKKDRTVIEINVFRSDPADRIVKGTIVPGAGVGDYTLDMSKDDVLKSLGQPKMIFYGDEKYTLNNLPRRYYMVFSDISFSIVDGSVNGIGVHGPSYKFTNGLGVGDSEQDIVQAFGDDFRFKESEWKDFLTYEDKGIQFEIHKKDRTVMELSVFCTDND